MKHLYGAALALIILYPSTSNAQNAADAVSPRVRAAQIEDERERLTAEQARIAAQIRALPVKPEQTMVDKPAGDTVKNDKTADNGKDNGNFAGLKLGAGLSFTLDIGKLDRISEAEIVNGIVRVTDQDNGRARIMLESHYFFTPCGRFLGISGLVKNADQNIGNGKCDSEDDTQARWGWGPFIAIQPGSGEIIDAIGTGMMVGFRRGTSSQSFNIGVGVVVDPNTRVLGDGFVENAPPPPGEEMTVRYRETLQTGILLLTSFSF